MNREEFVIVKLPNAILETMETEIEMAKKIEMAGRTCYKSEDKITPESSIDFIKMILNRRHGAMLEHANITVRFITDRGVSHEIVRHRIASYAQESTRYCNYSKDKFGNKISVIKPVDISNDSSAYDIWLDAVNSAAENYFKLLSEGCSPQIARSVLPTCTKTEIVVTMNIREWRHFFELRCEKAAHPDMKCVAWIALNKFMLAYPTFFSDIFNKLYPKRINANCIDPAYMDEQFKGLITQYCCCTPIKEVK